MKIYLISLVANKSKRFALVPATTEAEAHKTAVLWAGLRGRRGMGWRINRTEGYYTFVTEEICKACQISNTFDTMAELRKFSTAIGMDRADVCYSFVLGF